MEISEAENNVARVSKRWYIHCSLQLKGIGLQFANINNKDFLVLYATASDDFYL